MKPVKFLQYYCPEPAELAADKLFQKLQTMLARLRAELRQLQSNAEWSRKHQIDTEADQVIDVNVVGVSTIVRGCMTLEKFRQLAKDERAEWIEFNDKLLALTRSVVEDTERSAQRLNALSETMQLVSIPIETIEKFFEGTQQRNRFAKSKEEYLRHGRAIISDARIRLRYVRILNTSHNHKIFEQWNLQLQRDFLRSAEEEKILDRFCRTASLAVDEIIDSLTLPSTKQEIIRQRSMYMYAAVKSKRDILHLRRQRNQDETQAWELRAHNATKQGNSNFADHAARRSETSAVCARLYNRGFELMEKLCDEFSKHSRNKFKTRHGDGS